MKDALRTETGKGDAIQCIPAQTGRRLSYLPNRKIATVFASMDTHPLVDTASQPKTGQEAESSNPQGLSKKAQKRAAKAARLHELKLERRAREKVVKKNKRRERLHAIPTGELDKNTFRKRQRANGGGEVGIFNARVVVDLGFDELMSDKVGVSLCSCLLREVIPAKRRRSILLLLSWHIPTAQTDVPRTHSRY